MNEDTKDKSQPERPKFTKDLIDRQIVQTSKELSNYQDQVQRAIGLLQYLQIIKAKFDLPEAEKELFEVKE